MMEGTTTSQPDPTPPLHSIERELEAPFCCPVLSCWGSEWILSGGIRMKNPFVEPVHQFFLHSILGLFGFRSRNALVYSLHLSFEAPFEAPGRQAAQRSATERNGAVTAREGRGQGEGFRSIECERTGARSGRLA